MSSVPSIVNVYPSNGAIGIPIGDHVTVTFNQEMDEDSINTGTFVLTGPDQGVFFGGEMNPFEEPGINQDDILDSPYFPGFVQCTVTFSRVDASGSTVDDSVVDYTGDGTLWRTVATLVPAAPLAPNKDYQALVAGDEDTTNAFDTGVRSRTVFDAEPTAVVGTGIIYSGGGYTGLIDTAYIIKITTGGQTGNAIYSWWRESDPFTIYTGITVTGKRELENGVYITCDPDGTFVVDDQWKITCVPFVAMTVTYRWSFATGSGSIIVPPSTSSASGIDTLTSFVSGSSTSISSFSVSEVDPIGGQYGVEISTDVNNGERIIITFTDTIPTDPTTLVNNVAVRAEPAGGIDSLNQTTYTEELLFTTSLVGNNQLYIDLDPEQLYINNIVIITLDKDIADTSGNTLGTEYITYFSTTYSPIYATLRRVRLDLGALIADVNDETVMFAILEASEYADAISIAAIYDTVYHNFAKSEYTICKAEQILVKGIASGGNLTDRMSKTLGDLTVSRGGAREGINDTLNGLQDCLDYWEIAVKTGGEISPNASLKPVWTVKGKTSSDAISVSRQWEPTNGLGYYRPAANTSVTTNSTRKRLKTWRRGNR